jgi:hypothetical protein
MGESAAETVKEIEEVRDDLDHKVRELESRLPVPAVWTKRIAGIALGGGAASTIFWFLVRRIRSKRGEAAVKGPTSLVELSVPSLDADLKPWLVGFAGAWLVLRFAQLREARRTNRLLVRRAA